SVSLNIRFPKESSRGEGQYVIVSGSKYENGRISEMVLGTWEPEDEDTLFQRELLSELLFNLKEHKQKEEEAEQKRKEEERQKREAEQLAKQQEEAKARQSNSQMQNRRRGIQREILRTRSDSFLIDENISVNIMIQMMDHLSNYFLAGAPFNIRVVTLDGEPYSDIGQKGLRRFFEMRRRIVSRVNLDAATVRGELVDITIVFNSGQRQATVYLEITTFKNEEIREYIRKTLLFNQQYVIKPRTRPRPSEDEPNMVHEMFHFSQSEFSLDRVIRLITAISTKYLHGESPTAFLSTVHGETFPALSLRKLRVSYLEHQTNISFLLFSINQARTGQTFSLMFQFQSPGHEPYGILRMMWGDNEIHKIVRDLLWEQLDLSSYSISKSQVKEEVSDQSSEALPEGYIAVNPIFKERDFKPQPRTSLIIMPLEAYWSETLWVHIQHNLKSLGYNSLKAEALFSENVLDETWKTLNEVDLLVADLTYKHPDVFYKLGIAHTLGKKVMIISQHARDIPKDFSQFPIHVYDNNINGLQRLAEWLVDELESD
ncbi:MAG: cell envelope integrity protein TolA, partial [Bacteroidetes bacterium]|nr:cell envelope integrity protein TolA [Bacteroidota bacterium]